MLVWLNMRVRYTYVVLAPRSVLLGPATWLVSGGGPASQFGISASRVASSLDRGLLVVATVAAAMWDAFLACVRAGELGGLRRQSVEESLVSFKAFVTMVSRGWLNKGN